MNENKNNESLCKSVFKSGENTNKNQYTKAWIDLINILEKSKVLGNK